MLSLGAYGLIQSSGRVNPLETLVRLRGHIKSMTIQPGPTPEQNVFEFRFEEFKPIFRATGIRAPDQDVMSRLENKGDLFKFAVLKSDLKNPKLAKIDMYELSSVNSNYLNQGNTVEYVQKWRTLSKLLGMLCAAAFLFYLFRLRNAWTASKTPPPGDLTQQVEKLDALAVALVRRPARVTVMVTIVLGAWAVLAFGVGHVLIIAQATGVALVALLLLVSMLSPRLAMFQEVRDILTKNETILKKRPDTEMPSDLKALAELIQSPDGVDKVDANGQTALHSAASSGKTEAIELLLRGGAKINRKDSAGKTPLIIAAERNHLGAVLKLVDRGADANAKDAQGLTALAYAQKNNKEAIIGALSKAANAKPKILTAAQTGKLDEIVQLIRGGADIDQAESDGLTPLMLTIKGDYLGAARKLIEMGARLDVVNSAGQNPLQYAESLKKAEMIALLKNPPVPKKDEEKKAG